MTRQAQRAASWQPGLIDEDGLPSFGLTFYILAHDGSHAGVNLRGGGKYVVADPEHGVLAAVDHSRSHRSQPAS